MYSSRLLNSDTLFGPLPTNGPYRAYSPYSGFSSRSLSPHDRYYHALAEARSAELEMLESDRQEERFLQRRLQELRQTRVEQIRRDSPYTRYPIDSTSAGLSPYHYGHLEALRNQVQEEERLARLEAVERKRLWLQEESLRAVAKDNNNSREVPLFKEAGLSYRPRISQRADVNHLPSVQVAHDTPFTVSPFGDISVRPFIGRPRAKDSQPQKHPVHSDNFATRFDARRHHPEISLANHREMPKVSFQPSRSRQEEPPVASTSIDLNGILELLGLFASKNVQHQQEEKSTVPPKGLNGREVTSETQQQRSAKTHPFTRTENRQQEEHGKNSSRTPQSLDINLREQLEKRLKAEHENEVRDTIEAVLNSLYDIQSNPTGAEIRSTQPPRPSAKGKEKEYTSLPESNKTLSGVADNAEFQIKEIEKQFYALEREFVFPTNVDFIIPVPTTVGSAPATSHLSFTAANQPVRFFEQSLSQLLTRLDLIESQGNEELRNKRKDVVQKVEHALEDLEKDVEDRLKAKVAKESKRRSVTIEDVTSSDEHLGAELALSSQRIDEKEGVSFSYPTSTAVNVETVEPLSSPSAQISAEGPIAIPNLADKEPRKPEDRASQENANTEIGAQESTLQVSSSDVTPQIEADLLVQPSTPSETECLELKEDHAAEGCDSGPNTIASSEEAIDEIQTETSVQESPTESQDTAAAWLLDSAGLNTSTQNRKEGVGKERLSDEETSDVSDVESASSDWSEVDAAVPR